MRRRTMLKRIGAATVATGAASGTATARSIPTHGITRELDVSDVSGETTLGELLTAEEIAKTGVDPSRSIHIGSGVESIQYEDDCCVVECPISVRLPVECLDCVVCESNT
ncbi:MAG: hypothetical protein ABEI75_00205 [Halobaculum sp.]